MTIFALNILWAVWIGSIVTFSFVVAPAVFSVLDRDDARPVIRALFTGYYRLGIMCGIPAAGLALLSGADLRLTLPLAASAVIFLYSYLRILPAAEDARNQENEEMFTRLHHLSVRLNMTILAMLVLAGVELSRS